jgi:hypothetical protein
MRGIEGVGRLLSFSAGGKRRALGEGTERVIGEGKKEGSRICMYVSTEL